MIKIWTDLVMKVPEEDSKGAFLVNRSLREHFRGVPDDFRGPKMNNRGAVELFRRLRKVSKGLKRVRKGSECIERVQKVFRGQKASFEDKKCHSKWPKRMASRRLTMVSECQLSGVN